MNVELDGERIFDWRWRNFASAEKAAEMAGISPETWLRVENNRGRVRVKTARKIAAVMGVEPRSLGRRRLRAL